VSYTYDGNATQYIQIVDEICDNIRKLNPSRLVSSKENFDIYMDVFYQSGTSYNDLDDNTFATNDIIHFTYGIKDKNDPIC
jgi:hypothetical protein